MAKHFEGISVNYIECIHVDFKSEREEAFQDLQLNVKGCADVYAGFDAYCEPEVMDGQNQYLAEGHGLQVGLALGLELGVLYSQKQPAAGSAAHSKIDLPAVTPAASRRSLWAEPSALCAWQRALACRLGDQDSFLTHAACSQVAQATHSMQLVCTAVEGL